jgi:2,4-dienoyl-CoA reductase-like NADH-dependent reductase (Old Yellow Enzyme family)
VHTTGCKLGIQLAHAGRKASTYPPFIGKGHSAYVPVGKEDCEGSGCFGFETVAPSPIPYSAELSQPRELSQADIRNLISDFQQAAIRADKAGLSSIYSDIFSYAE